MCDTFTWSPRDVAGTLANTAPRRKWKEQTGRDRDERLRYFRNIWKLKSVWADIYNFLQYLHVCRPFIWRDKTFINWWIYVLRNNGLPSTKQTRSQLMLCLMSLLVQKLISNKWNCPSLYKEMKNHIFVKSTPSKLFPVTKTRNLDELVTHNVAICKPLTIIDRNTATNFWEKWNEFIIPLLFKSLENF